VDIEEILGGVKTLDTALAAAARARPPWRVADVVAMDEYSHDVVLASRDGRWAVLDAT
jgi:hypothetical protein